MRNRAWILPTWFDYVERAFAAAGVEPCYAFAISLACEDQTEPIIYEHAANALITFTDDAPIANPELRWVPSRFAEMAKARNALLNLVRYAGPKFFLSLDSDILLHRDTLPQLIETYGANDWSGVGGKAYMSNDRDCPSYAFDRAMGGLAREDSEGIFRTDVIMALKLLDAHAYNVDYVTCDKGEDVGWSRECRRAGITLGWDGRTANKHVMGPASLARTDDRCGY